MRGCLGLGVVSIATCAWSSFLSALDDDGADDADAAAGDRERFGGDRVGVEVCFDDEDDG